MWNLPAPPGFQGLHLDKPISVRVRLLPYWRQDGATYFATFRLGDSLPEAKVRGLREFRVAWKREHPAPRSNQLLEEFSREVFTRVERWVDQGDGHRIIRDEEHLYRVLQYIGRNPKKAGLPLTMCPRWVRPDWIALGWKFEEL